MLMIASAVVLSGLFFLAFERTVAGKALRATAVNRVGARLVGIRPARTALLAYSCASLLAGLIGVLVAPVTTMYYDSGFLIGLKAFVAAIIGGLVSYPLTAVGALAVGVVESFALVLERGAEGRDRVQPADPGADAALGARAACRGRSRGDRPVTAARCDRARAAWSWHSRWRRSRVGNFGVSLLNDIGIGALVALGLVLLTGVGGATSFGQAAFVGIAAYAHRLAHDRAGPVAVARAASSRCCSPGLRPWRSGCSRCAWAATSCRCRPSPGGCRSRCCSATSRRSGRHTGLSNIPPLQIGGWSLADPRAIYYLIWVLVGLAMPVQPQRAAVATGPRDPQPARRRRRCSPAWAPMRSGSGSRCS